MSHNDHHELVCPRPECAGMLKVPDNLPAGEYECRCKEIKVNVRWATYLGKGRKPYLAMVVKP